MTTDRHDHELPAALAEALAAGKQIADAGSRVTSFVVNDQDMSLSVPIAIIPAANGAMAAQSLLAEMEKGIALARKVRLRDAVGPDRREGTATSQTLASLIAHTNRFKDTDSAVWANAVERHIVALLDYHRQGAAGETRWGTHRSVYDCPLSEAWKAWGGGAPITMTQEAFAAHLDARDRDLTDERPALAPGGLKFPSPAQLVSIANSLEAYAGQKAKRERDPQTGRVKMSFSTESGFSGDVTPPPSFAVRIPVFRDSEAEPFEVRLRCDVGKDASASFTFQIHQATTILDAAFAEIVARVGAETSLPVFVGVPEYAGK